jgi:hypothetical protein
MLALSAVFSVSAQPPEGADPNSEIARWFRSLKSKQGALCCDISDCRRVEARSLNGHYQALIDNLWSQVPDEIVVNVKNPTSSYIACYAYYDYPGDGAPHFYCFIPISGEVGAAMEQPRSYESS